MEENHVNVRVMNVNELQDLAVNQFATVSIKVASVRAPESVQLRGPGESLQNRNVWLERVLAAVE